MKYTASPLCPDRFKLWETRYKGASCAFTGIPLARLHLSKVAAVNLPASGAICNPSPRFDGNLYRFIGAKRVSAAQYFVALAFLSSPPASPYGKGRCHEGTEGIRRSEIEQTIPQSCFACQLPLHKGAIKICKRGVPSLVMPFCFCERGTMDDGNITESPIT